MTVRPHILTDALGSRHEILPDARFVPANPFVDLLSLNQQTVWLIARSAVGFDGVCRILDFWQRNH
jgi:hypothetical protein